MHRNFFVSLTSSLLLSIACGPDAGAPSAPLEGWLGTEPHFVVQGVLQGEQLDLRLDDNVARDPTSLFCIREYNIPEDATGNLLYAAGAMKEIKVRAPFNVNGQLRVAELELKHHDFQSDPLDANVSIVARPEDAALPSSSEMWLEWEWHGAAGGDQLFEEAAESGSFTLGELSGEPGADGLVIPSGEGAAGGFARARFAGGDELAISVCAPCIESDIDTPDE